MKGFKLKRSMKRSAVAVLTAALMTTTACNLNVLDRLSRGGDSSDEGSYTDVQQEFDDFLYDEYVDSVTSDTITYNYMIKDGDSLGIPEPEVTIGDYDMSDEGIAESKSLFDETFDKLKAFDRDELTEEQQLTYDILYEYMENESLAYLNIYLSEPFSPMKGLQANISTYFTDYRFDDKGDVERYLEVLGMVRDYFGKALDFERTKSEKGYFMSDAVCDEVIEQCEDYISETDNHFMIQVFNDNIEALDFLTDDEVQSFEEQNEKLVKDSLIPAFQDVIDVLGLLKGTGTNDSGLCGYEGGKEYYEYLLKDTAGTSKTPEEVADMLEEQYDELMSGLYAIAMSDYSSYEYYVSNYDNLFSDTDSMDPTEIVNTLMETATENYPDVGNISFRAEELNESLEDIQDSILAYYMSPAIDDQDNNLIRVNGKHTDGMWTTLAHEGYPGHMLQNYYYMSTEPEPIRDVMRFLGYSEGWAMYACYDALDYYEFDDIDSSGNVIALYKIENQLNYLVMGRIDIGINYEGWTVDDTSSYLDENGFSGDAAEEMYTLLAGDPAVYQSYSTGYYEMADLREYAEKQLGTEFDAKEFNTVILETGPCQFDILRQQVDKYISDKQ